MMLPLETPWRRLINGLSSPLATALLALAIGAGGLMAVIPESRGPDEPVAVELAPETLQWIAAHSGSAESRRAQTQFALALKRFALTALTRRDEALKQRAAALARAQTCMARIEGAAAASIEKQMEAHLGQEGLAPAIDAGRRRLRVIDFNVSAEAGTVVCDTEVVSRL